MFRRKNFKYMKSDPKKVIIQLHIQKGQEIEQTSVFEVNVEGGQACQRIFLDDKREFYVICQT